MKTLTITVTLDEGQADQFMLKPRTLDDGVLAIQWAIVDAQNEAKSRTHCPHCGHQLPIHYLTCQPPTRATGISTPSTAASARSHHPSSQ